MPAFSRANSTPSYSAAEWLNGSLLPLGALATIYTDSQASPPGLVSSLRHLPFMVLSVIQALNRACSTYPRLPSVD